MFKLSDIYVGFVPMEKICVHEADIIADSVNILFSNQYPLRVSADMLCVVINEQYNIFIKYYIVSLIQNGATRYAIRVGFDKKIYPNYYPNYSNCGVTKSGIMDEYVLLGISKIIYLDTVESRMLEDFMLTNNIGINIDIIQHDNI